MEFFDDERIKKGKIIAIIIIVILSSVIVVDLIISINNKVMDNFLLQIIIKFISIVSLFYFYKGKKLAFWIVIVILFNLYINFILIISFILLEKLNIINLFGGSLMLIFPILLALGLYYIFIVKTNLQDDFLQFIKYQNKDK